MAVALSRLVAFSEMTHAEQGFVRRWRAWVDSITTSSTTPCDLTSDMVTVAGTSYLERKNFSSDFSDAVLYLPQVS